MIVDTYTGAPENVLQFGKGILASHVTAYRSLTEPNTLVLKLQQGSTITLDTNGPSVLGGSYQSIGTIQFANGTLWNSAYIDQLFAMAANAPGNWVPSANDDTLIGLKDVALNLSPAALLANDVDHEGGALTLLNVANAQHGTVVLDGNGTITFTPEAGYVGQGSFTYDISDPANNVSTGTVTINIWPPNIAPAAVVDTVTVAEDAQLSFAAASLLTNDTDGDGDALVVLEVMAGQRGSVALAADGTITFVPDQDFNGLGGFDYRITDGKGGYSVAHVDLVITAVNDQPIAIADSGIFAREDFSFVFFGSLLTTNDVDLDGDDLTILTLQDAVHGQVSQTPDGVFMFTPDADYNGTASFTYTVGDGAGGTSTSTVSLTVLAANDDPTIGSIVLNSISEDTVALGQVFASDIDGDALNYSISSSLQPQKGTVTFLENGGFTYTPFANATGTDSFRVRVSDGLGGVVRQDVTVDIIAVNDAPVAVVDSVTTDEDTAVIANVITNDTDFEGDVIALVSAVATHGAVSISGGEITYTPDSNFYGSDVVTYEISDGNGGTATGTLTVTVNPVNDGGPEIQNIIIAPVAEDMPAIGQVTATDVDGDSLTYGVKAGSGPTKGLVTFNPSGNGDFTYTPTANTNGADSFTVIVSDGQISAEQVVNVAIAAVNDAPTGAPTTTLATGTEDVAYVVDASALLAGFSDVEGDTLSVTNLTSSSGSVTNNGNGTFTISAPANANGVVTLSYDVTDGNSGSLAGQTRTFTRTAVNDAPTGAPTTTLATGTEDVAYVVDASALLAGFSDVEGDTLSVANLTSSSGSVTNNGNGTFTISAPANANGVVTLSYDVTDGNSGSLAGQTRTFTRTAVNDAPTGAPTTTLATGTEDVAYVVDASALLAGFSDVEGDTLSVANLTSSSGSVTNNGNGTFTISAPANANGVVTLSYDVTDGNSGSLAGQTRTFTRTAVNDAPTIVSGATGPAITENAANSVAGSVIYIAAASDPDGDVVTWSLVGADAALLNIDAGGNVRLNAAADFEQRATYSFTVVAASSGTLTDQKAVIVNVNDINPEIVVGTASDDTIYGGAQNDNLSGLAGNDTLYGGGGIDTLNGGDGNDTLDGGADADGLTGGLGNDIYVVGAGDTITELASQGTDEIRTVLATYSLLSSTTLANIENLTGTLATGQTLTGNALANIITGAAGNDTLNGGSGNDTINGGGGIDTADYSSAASSVTVSLVLGTGTGGGGSDTLVNIENVVGSAYNDAIAGNSLSNNLDGGDGIDTVSYAYAATAVTIDLDGAAFGIGGEIDQIFNFENADGGSGWDALYGTDGNNILNGGAGADHMFGRGGDDTYYVDNAGDVVSEAVGSGTDTVIASVDYMLADYINGDTVENLIFIGSAGISAFGNGLNNVLIGNAGGNYIEGLAGNDHIYGRAGQDTLWGDSGGDRFYFDSALGAAHADTIFDFSRAQGDKIVLDKTIYAKLTVGNTLAAGNFRSNANSTAAGDANDYIIYNAATGNLYYDTNGNGAGQLYLIASLPSWSGHLLNTDFVVIA